MTTVRKYELRSGLATGLSSLYLLLTILLTPRREHEKRLLGFLLFILPAWLVAMGSYFHVVKRQSWGRVLLGVLAAYYLVITPISFLMVAYWGTSSGRAIPFFIPPVTAMLTFTLSLFREKGAPDPVTPEGAP